MSLPNLATVVERARSGATLSSPSPEDYLHIFNRVGQVAQEEARARGRRLAARQGVAPNHIDELAGQFWPEDETADEFLKWLAGTRKDNSDRRLPE